MKPEQTSPSKKAEKNYQPVISTESPLNEIHNINFVQSSFQPLALICYDIPESIPDPAHTRGLGPDSVHCPVSIKEIEDADAPKLVHDKN